MGRKKLSRRQSPGTVADLFRSRTSKEAPTGHDGPPTKRRRLLGPEETGLKRPEECSDSVVLASIDVNIYPSYAECPDTSLAGIEIPVVLKNVLHTSPQDLRITVRGDYEGSTSCDLTICSTSEQLATDLRHVLMSTPKLTQGKKFKLTELVWSSCSLVMHADASRTRLHLKAKIYWTLGLLAAEMKRPEAENILKTYMPDPQGASREQWSPQDFYGSVHIPPHDMKIPAALDLGVLRCQLFPFQQRAVSWLLQREGVDTTDGGSATAFDNPPTPNNDTPPSFHAVKDAEGRPCYVSHLRGMVVTDISVMYNAQTQVRGGILAEEMGLGKTVEILALITLHKRRFKSHSPVLDTYTGSDVLPSRATLIITPSSILEQWKSELRSHAPNLKVYHYQGLKDLTVDDDRLRTTLIDNDVVLTTYNVLAREIHYARPAPQRDLRTAKKYEPRKSPLMQVSWWRVCLDEAQMVENGVSNAATVARLIPRVNAWAVSGTPLRKDVKDLLGLLMFLRYEPYCDSSLLWYRLVTRYKESFKDILSKIALRHTKKILREELRIPRQKRVVITVPFTAVEEQHYAHMFQQMCDDCGLSIDGDPMEDDWDPDATATIEKMRNWLTRLRQTCLHPEVGGRNRRALGRENGPLRTVGEVLQVMIEQNDATLRTEERAMLMAQISRGQIFEFGGEPQQALRIFLQVLEQSTALVDEARRELDRELALQHQAVEITSTLNAASASEAADDAEDAQEEKNARVGVCRNRLRTLLEIQHVCTFFAANTFYQLKNDKSREDIPTEESEGLEKQELEFYERAKAIRKELLSEVYSKASRRMRKISQAVKLEALTKVPSIKSLQIYGGIENRKLADRACALIDLLNDQATQLIKWREAVVERLLLPLVDEDEEQGLETTGDEYETSTKKQDEVYVYLDALRALVADRHCAITGQKNELINHEMKYTLTLANNGQGHAPELFVEAMAARSRLIPDDELGSLRALITEARSMITALQWQEGQGGRRAIVEQRIVEAQLSELHRTTQEQMKVFTGLEQELSLFRDTMNQRLEFYRQLQQVSDTIAPPKEAMDDEVDQAAIRVQLEKERQLSAKIASLKTKQRFLLHLRTESNQEGAPKQCVICQSRFEVGVLTVCGHQYCKDCIRAWWNEHRSCPLCKKRLALTDFHQITYKPQEIKVQEESSPSTPEGSPSSIELGHGGIYSDMPMTTLNEIKAVDIEGSYGTKIDTLARHIIYLRSADPGSKSIVFSQYTSFLDLLSTALTHFRIGHTSINKPNGIVQFQNDPSKEVFLLHAKADSSGLNLVNATHVFLCEPLINPALELQAIARVHRIGQRRPTTVYMYLVEGTVEEAIYDISVRRRMAHISQDTKSSNSGNVTPTQEMAIEAANSLELQQAQFTKLFAKGKSGGEMVEKEDLWTCLFSKPRLARSGHAAMAQIGLEAETAVGMEVGRFLRAEAADGRTQQASGATEREGGVERLVVRSRRY